MEIGYAIRFKRDGKWQSLDVAELTPRELEEWIDSLSYQERAKWLYAIVNWIKTEVKEVKYD